MASVEVVDCEGQIGSGALPTQTIPSAGLALRPLGAGEDPDDEDAFGRPLSALSLIHAE